MDSSLPILSFAGVAVMATAAAYPKLRARLALSRAKHGSLTGHSKMSRRVARLIPFYEFDVNDFFRSDGAPAEVATLRQDGFFRLAQLYRDRFARSREMTLQASAKISDLQFTEAYRVPFQYSRLVREHLGTGAFVQSSAGVTVTDLDGNIFHDLTGSYGVNIFGNDFYKECIAKAEARAHALGPVLGPYHPVVADNVTRLCGISGLDEVSFHMSGTEAVMQAVRLARYHTRRSHLVRFAGRNLYPGRHVEADAPGPENAARYRLRPGQSAAGASSQRQHAGRFGTGRQFAQRAFRSRGLQRLAPGAAAGLHRAQHRPDL